jgi:phenylacetate-CoA ligase
VIVPAKQKTPPYWRISSPLRQIKFSTFHGSPSTYGYYFEEINKRQLAWIHGYPSCIVPFASYMIEKGLKFNHKIEFVTTGGENLYDYQRNILQEAFGCSPRTHYGLTECVANFSERKDGVCEVDEDFAAVEFVRDNDMYRIIGTNLMNYAMPLLRYDTSDLAMIDGAIGNQGRIVKFVDGRSGDCLYFPDGKKIGSFSALFTETSHIQEAQLYQKKDFSVIIRFVARNGDWRSDIENVGLKLRERIGNSLSITYEKVDKLPRTKNNKLRYVISEVDTR